MVELNFAIFKIFCDYKISCHFLVKSVIIYIMFIKVQDVGFWERGFVTFFLDKEEYNDLWLDNQEVW